jgi:hypothetical protein
VQQNSKLCKDYMIRKKLLQCSIVLALLALVPSTWAQGRGFKLPPNAQEIEPGAYYLGRARDFDGRVVDGIAFLHPRLGFAKPGGKGKPGGGSTCYSFLASGARWKNVESYVVDAVYGDGTDALDIQPKIASGLQLWNSAAGKTIFGGQNFVALPDGADTAAPDGKNEFQFGEIQEPGVIAVTIVWGIFSGPPQWRELVEWDMVFDDVSFNWGNADVTNELTSYPVEFMDFLNIFVHEGGHAAGLGHPSSDCTEETMYAYAENGETKKRTLNAGDVAGIKALYK